MTKDKVIVFLDKHHRIFSRIFEILSDKVEFKFMWVGRFKPARLFRAFPTALYYRLKGFKIVHFEWLEMYYLEGSPLKSRIMGSLLLAGVFFLKLIGMKIVWTCHNIRPHEDIYPELSGWVRRFFAELCDHVFVMHEEIIPVFREAFSYKGDIMAVCEGDYREISSVKVVSRDEARKALNIPEDLFVMLAIGNIRRYKKLGIWIDAFKGLEDGVREKAIFIIGGKATDRALADDLARLAADESQIQCNFNYIPDENMVLYVAASDVIVAPQHMQGVSGNIYLAASFGIPVITTTESGATASLVREWSMGEVYQPDRTSLMAGLRRLCENREALRPYGDNAKRFISKNSWEKAAGRHLDVYKKLS